MSKLLLTLLKIAATSAGASGVREWAEKKLLEAALDVAVASGVAKATPKQEGQVPGFDRSSVAQPQPKPGEVVIGERRR